MNFLWVEVHTKRLVGRRGRAHTVGGIISIHNKNVIPINTSYKKNDPPRLKTFY